MDYSGYSAHDECICAHPKYEIYVSKLCSYCGFLSIILWYNYVCILAKYGALLNYMHVGRSLCDNCMYIGIHLLQETHAWLIEIILSLNCSGYSGFLSLWWFNCTPYHTGKLQLKMLKNLLHVYVYACVCLSIYLHTIEEHKLLKLMLA